MRLASEAFLPLIRITELRYPLNRQRELASSLQPSEPSALFSLALSLFQLICYYYARDKVYLPLFRRADL